MTRPSTRRARGPRLVLALVALLLFWNSVQPGKVWEDDETVFQNSFMAGPAGIPYLFTPEYWVVHDIAHGGAYRPLVQSLFALEHAAWRDDPRGYHLTNVLLHALAVLTAYALVRRLAGRSGPAFLAALLFAAHPTRSEAVCWLKNRAEILGSMGVMLAVLAYARAVSRERVSRLGLLAGAAVSAAALLCKGVAIVTPILLALYAACFLPRRRWPAALAAAGPFWAVALLYVAFKLFVLSGDVPRQDAPPFIPPGHRVQIPGWTAFFYERLMLFPLNLCADRDYFVPSRRAALSLFVSIAALLAAAAPYGAWLLKRWRGAAAFAACWFLAALLPYINVLYIEVRPLADQRMYLPGLSYCALWGLWAAGRRARAGRTALVVLLALTLGALTAQRNFAWRDMYALFYDAARGAPGMARVHSNLGAAYHRFNRLRTAKRHLLKSVAIDPMPKAVRLLGLTLANLGEDEAAKAALLQAFRQRRESVTCKALGSIYARERRWAEAAYWFKEALLLRPFNPDALFALGMCYWETGQLERAERALRRSLDQKRTNAQAWMQLGNVCARTGRTREAVRYYIAAMELAPRDAEPCVNYGLAMLQLGKRDEAERAFLRALSLNPALLPAHVNLAQLLMEQKDWRRAAAHWRVAVRLRPRIASYWANWATCLERAGALDSAARAYDAALRLAPRAWPTAVAAGRLALRRGRRRDALHRFALALKFNPDCRPASEAVDAIARRLIRR